MHACGDQYLSSFISRNSGLAARLCWSRRDAGRDSPGSDRFLFFTVVRSYFHAVGKSVYQSIFVCSAMQSALSQRSFFLLLLCCQCQCDVYKSLNHQPWHYHLISYAARHAHAPELVYKLSHNASERRFIKARQERQDRQEMPAKEPIGNQAQFVLMFLVIRRGCGLGDESLRSVGR